MPLVRFYPRSQRGKRIDDPVERFVLEGDRVGVIRDRSGIMPTGKRFTVDAPPDNYRIELRIDGFEDFFGGFQLPSSDRSRLVPVRLDLQHKCSDLPEFDEMSQAQRTLFATFAGGRNPSQVWDQLGDNRCATFFQISHALTETRLANGRTLDEYFDAVIAIGGVQIRRGRRTATGWRMYTTVPGSLRGTIEADIVNGGVFGARDGFTHPTHAKFGFVKSHRQTGPLPRIQIVLSEDNSAADLDLDVRLHRSSPHDAYDDFIQKYPGVDSIYRFD